METLILSNRLNNLLKDRQIILKDKTIIIIIPNEFNNNLGNHFDIRKGEISYYPKSKGAQPLNDSGKWIREGRQTIKPGKFAAILQYKDESTNEIIKEGNFSNIYENVANLLKSGKNEGFNISGNISEIYAMKESENLGYLQNSCMRLTGNYGCRKFSNFYDKIPGLKIVYKKDANDYLLFRALLWSVTVGNKKRIFLDRIYGTDDTNTYLHDIAKSKNWLYRNFSSDAIYDNGEVINDNISFKTKVNLRERGEEDGTPYIDTLCFLDGNGKLNTSDGDVIRSCDGNALNECSCYNCGARIDEDNCQCDPNGNILCDNCYNENYFYCEICEETYDREDMVNCDDNCYCSDCAERKGYYLCESCNEYHKDGQKVNGTYYCDDCLNNEFSYCEECEEYKPNDEFTEVTGDYICDDCKRNNYIKCDICENYTKDDYIIKGISYCEECYDNEISEMISEYMRLINCINYGYALSEDEKNINYSLNFQEEVV